MITYDVISKVHYEIKSITWTCLLLFASDIGFIDESIYFSQTCSSDFTGLRIKFFLFFLGFFFSWCVTCSLTCNRSSETFSADKGQTKVRQRSDVVLHWRRQWLILTSSHCQCQHKHLTTFLANSPARFPRPYLSSLKVIWCTDDAVCYLILLCADKLTTINSC